MAEPHSYIALDWVTGEIEDTLKQARQSLQVYVSDREDFTKLRFCLTYAHQVHGSLKMVELRGGALLAAEVESLVQSLVNKEMSDEDEALELLMAGLIQLSTYLQRVNDTRQEQPASLVPLINDIRQLIGKEKLTESLIFNPELDIPGSDNTQMRESAMDGDEFNQLIRSLRQGYQQATAGIVRDKDLEANYEKLHRVCERLHSVSKNTASDCLWKICHSVTESLSNAGAPASVDVKAILKDIDFEIKLLLDNGVEALDQVPDSALLKRLLYIVAIAEPFSDLIREVQEEYQLKAALLDADAGASHAVAQPDSSAIRAVSDAINEELFQIQNMLENFALGNTQLEELADILPIFHRVMNAMSVLGATSALEIIREQMARVASMLEKREDINIDELVDIAAQMIHVQNFLIHTKDLDDESYGQTTQLDLAHESVIREARNGLEDTKEAIIEFVASKWSPQTLENVPSLLEEIRGGLLMIPLHKAAAILQSSQRFIRENLLSSSDIPEWRTLDTLADAITSVEYYLECLSSSNSSDLDSILNVAEESVQALGFPIPEIVEAEQSSEITQDSEEPRPKAEVIDLQARQAQQEEQAQSSESEVLSQNDGAADTQSQTHTSEEPSKTAVVEDKAMAQKGVSSEASDSEADEIIDDEIIEIFIEEAAEVLETINENFPAWQANHDDQHALAELRRSFHTLKGSGRMVGATVIGELAWSIENMLNQAISGSQPITSFVIEIVAKTISIIPDMVADFEAQNKINVQPVNELISAANKVAGIEAAVVFPLESELASSSEKAAPAAKDSAKKQVDTTTDSELLMIFVSEANTHSAALETFVAQAQASEDGIDVSEDLQRALHTLKGSASMAEVVPIVDVIAPIEVLVKELRTNRVKADSRVIDIFQGAVELVKTGIKDLTSLPLDTIPGTDEFVAKVIALTHELQGTMTAVEQAGASESLAKLFEEGMEKLLHASDKLSMWAESREPVAEEIGGKLISDFASLGTIAHEAGQPEVANLAKGLADLYKSAVANPKKIKKTFFRLAEQTHEALINMMDSLALGQSVIPAVMLLDKLKDMEQSIALKQVKSNRAQPQHVNELPVADTITTVLANIDEETLLIFAEEASDLIDDLDAQVSLWLGERDNAAPKDALMRVLHTLKGGARLAGITTLGDLTHNYETFLESCTDYTGDFFTQLQEHHDRLQNLVAAVFGGGFQRLAQSTADGQSTDDDREVEVDEEVLEIFFEESQELLESIEDSVHSWIGDITDLEHMEQLKRLLHTLKGGARLAGITTLGDLTHEYESYVIASESDRGFEKKGFVVKLREYQDKLTRGVAEVAQEVKTIADSKEALPQSDMANLVPISGELPETRVTQAAIDATRAFIEGFERDQTQTRGPQEVVKVAADLLENLVNLAGETSISRSRIEQQISELNFGIDEMEMTIERLKGQLRRLDIETQAQVVFRQEQVESEGMETFDPLEMDRYSHLQQLSRSLIESASDLQDVKETFANKMRDMETLLVQQQRINTELQEGLMRSQMVPFSRLVPRLRRIVRQVSVEVGKEVEFLLANVEGELDRTVLERMVAPLEHMLRNAVDHGIESKEDRLACGKTPEGNITLGLAREGGEVVLTLSDDGAGIDIDAVKEKAVERGLMDKDAHLSDHEILQFILHAGFSTAQSVTQLSGRGVGMDVVHSEIKQLGGSMDIQSVKGKGTHFIVRLPFTVSVNRALMVDIGRDTYAIPLNTIEGIVRVSPYELEAYYQPDAPDFDYAGQSYQLRYMGSLLNAGTKAKLEGQTMPLPVILVRSKEHSVAVQVDRLLGSREIVVKTLGPQFSMVDGLSGATVLGDGGVVVIIDLLALIRADISQGYREELLDDKVVEVVDESNLLVMVVDDSVTVRKVTSRFLERQGMDVVLAKDGLDAVTLLQEEGIVPDVMLLDIEMPRMDGFEVASRVRHNERLKDLPIIMITSRTGEKHRERALSLGVNGYLGKPYQETELLKNILELVGREQTG